MSVRIKGWAKFQHFKDRRPPWIKLYRDILEDPDWHELDGDTAKVLVALWLIASEDEDQEGKLPDARRLAFRLRISEAKANQALTKLSHWVERDDISVISDGYQVDAPERAGEETETETETEKRQRQNTVACPNGVSPLTWSDFLQHRKAMKAPVTESSLKGLEREAGKAGWSLEKALVECCARGWRGFKAEWVQKDQSNRTEHQKRQDATARALFGNMFETPGMKTIEGEVINENAPRLLG